MFSLPIKPSLFSEWILQNIEVNRILKTKYEIHYVIFFYIRIGF
jgi:hypothetical protein